MASTFSAASVLGRGLAMRRRPSPGLCDAWTARFGFDHRLGPFAGTGQEVGNKSGLRHVVPIFLRHVRAHRVGIDARRIEGARDSSASTSSSISSLRGASLLLTAGPKLSASPSQCIKPSGVRMVQRIDAKRSTKNDDTCRRIWWSGSNQAM